MSIPEIRYIAIGKADRQPDAQYLVGSCVSLIDCGVQLLPMRRIGQLWRATFPGICGVGQVQIAKTALCYLRPVKPGSGQLEFVYHPDGPISQLHQIMVVGPVNARYASAISPTYCSPPTPLFTTPAPPTATTATSSSALKIAMMKNGALGVQVSNSLPPSFVKMRMPAPPPKL